VDAGGTLAIPASTSVTSLVSSGNITGTGTLTASTFDFNGGTVGASLSGGTVNFNGATTTVNGNLTAGTLTVGTDTTDAAVALNGNSTVTTLNLTRGSLTDAYVINGVQTLEIASLWVGPWSLGGIQFAGTLKLPFEGWLNDGVHMNNGKLVAQTTVFTAIDSVSGAIQGALIGQEGDERRRAFSSDSQRSQIDDGRTITLDATPPYLHQGSLRVKTPACAAEFLKTPGTCGQEH
jgi:hypothetical protein